MASRTVVEINNLNFSFGAGALRKQILFNLAMEVRRGEIVILTGPSGSGKTTLLTLIGALRSAREGSLRVLGQELRGAGRRQLVAVRRRIGYIFQSHNLLRSLTARQNVQMALELNEAIVGSEARRRAAEMLARVGLGEFAERLPTSLSGGQKQRVAIARALAHEPQLVLADEPTAALDSQAGRQVVELMRRLARERGAPILMVTHDNRILDIADRLIHLEDGQISEERRIEAAAFVYGSTQFRYPLSQPTLRDLQTADQELLRAVIVEREDVTLHRPEEGVTGP
jgi:putative ABC transport system ATP-binding protein